MMVLDVIGLEFIFIPFRGIGLKVMLLIRFMIFLIVVGFISNILFIDFDIID